ncbi:hypothetical protein [Thermosipho affectus]|nr:hypothetical protein [Thermosipho affectus]
MDELIVFDLEASEAFVHQMSEIKKPCVYLEKNLKVLIYTASFDNEF